MAIKKNKRPCLGMSKLLNIEMQLFSSRIVSCVDHRTEIKTESLRSAKFNVGTAKTTRNDQTVWGWVIKKDNIKNVDPIFGMCLLWLWVWFVGIRNANNIQCNKLIIERFFFFMLRNHLARCPSRPQLRSITQHKHSLLHRTLTVRTLNESKNELFCM